MSESHVSINSVGEQLHVDFNCSRTLCTTFKVEVAVVDLYCLCLNKERGIYGEQSTPGR